MWVLAGESALSCDYLFRCISQYLECGLISSGGMACGSGTAPCQALPLHVGCVLIRSMWGVDMALEGACAFEMPF
jgi:hypothetical protein